MLKQSYICYYIIFMTVPLSKLICLFFPEKLLFSKVFKGFWYFQQHLEMVPKPIYPQYNFPQQSFQIFFRIGTLKNFTNFTGQHLRCCLFLIKPELFQKETPRHVVCFLIFEILKNTFFLNNTSSGCFCVFWRGNTKLEYEENGLMRELELSTMKKKAS